MSRLAVEGLIDLLPTGSFTPELLVLLVSDGFTLTVTIARGKEFEQGGFSRRHYGRAASYPGASSPTVGRALSTTLSTIW